MLVYRIRSLVTAILLRWNDHELYPTKYVYICCMSVTIWKINNNINHNNNNHKQQLHEYTDFLCMPWRPCFMRTGSNPSQIRLYNDNVRPRKRKPCFMDTDGMEQYLGLVCTHSIYLTYLTSHYSHKYIALPVITECLWNKNCMSVTIRKINNNNNNCTSTRLFCACCGGPVSEERIRTISHSQVRL